MNELQWRAQSIEFLDNAAETAERFGFPHPAGRLRGLADSLRELRYQVAFVGMIKAGKSSLLNALLGEALFPVGAVPLTPVITAYVRDSEQVQVIWIDPDGKEETLVKADAGRASPERVYRALDAKFKALNEQYAREYGISLQDQDAVLHRSESLPAHKVEVHYPLGPAVERVVLVDTPGAGDLTRVRSDVLYNYLDLVDAAVVVLNARQPITYPEAMFVKERLLAKGIKRLFFVLNQIDLMNTEKDRRDQIKYVEDMLRRVLGGEVEVYPVSAYLALLGAEWQQGKIDPDKIDDEDEKFRFQRYQTPERMLAAGNVELFREALWSFLGSSGLRAEQIRAGLDKAAIEVKGLHREVEQTERLLGGEGEGEVAQAVRRIRELGERAATAKRELQLIDRSKRDVEEICDKAKTSRILEVLPATPEEAHEYQSMKERMLELIDKRSLDELAGEGEFSFGRKVEEEWGRYWSGKREQVINLLQEIEEEARRAAETGVNAALAAIGTALGMDLGVPPQLLPKVEKGAEGQRTGFFVGLAGGVLAGSAVAPGPGTVIGGIIGGIAGLLGGSKYDEIKAKQEFQKQLTEILTEIGRLLEEVRKAAQQELDRIRSELLQQIDEKRAEIKHRLEVMERESREAERTVEQKRRWLEEFRPALARLEEDLTKLRSVELRA